GARATGGSQTPGTGDRTDWCRAVLGLVHRTVLEGSRRTKGKIRRTGVCPPRQSLDSGRNDAANLPWPAEPGPPHEPVAQSGSRALSSWTVCYFGSAGTARRCRRRRGRVQSVVGVFYAAVGILAWRSRMLVI